MLIISIASAVAVALLLVCLLIVRSVVAAKTDLPLSPEWIDELSVERYRPMARLLDERDLEFLRSQPGFTSKMESELRIQRCRIFRSYLSGLEADFRRVCTAVKVLMLQSRRDRPELAVTVLRQQARFAFGIATVNLRLFLYRWGLAGMDVSILFQSFDAMRLELKSLAPSCAAA